MLYILSNTFTRNAYYTPQNNQGRKIFSEQTMVQVKHINQAHSIGIIFLVKIFIASNTYNG